MSTPPAKILTIDDEKSVCLTCRRVLEEDGHTVEYAFTAREGIERCTSGDFELVLLDLKLPDMSGMEVLETLRRVRPDVIVIIITGYATIQTSIQAIKKGAFDYVPKPFTPDELSLVVTKALEDRALRTENELLKQELSFLLRDTKLLGRSKAMQDILMQIRKVSPSDFTVTIYGESGTGKELIARAIHENSQRSEGPFVAVDLSALSQGLVESELFGHVKGAFTGATQNRPGFFASAGGGTLFLDEISNVSWELQGKLLRAIESRTIRPVGSEKEVEVDVRIVAATNRDLFELVEAEKFREDLYYRLNVIPIVVPPLRERTDDIPLLAMHFLKETQKHSLNSRLEGFTSEAMAKLLSYHWPGNVRELKNTVERMVATTDDDLIRVEHLPAPMVGSNPQASGPTVETVPETIDQLKEAKRKVKDVVFSDVERRFVMHALAKTNWNVTKAAQGVGMQRSNFHALMRKYGIRARGHEP